MAFQSAKNTIGPNYAEQLRKEHAGSKWGSTGFRYSGAALGALIEDRPYLQTAYDYGCGKGSLAKAFDELEWVEYDPGIPEKSTKQKGRYDLVTCTDVLEHVEPDLLDAVLADLAEATGKVLFLDVACYPTGKTFGEGPYIGQDLHLIVEPPAWWLARCEAGLPGLRLHEFNASKKASKGGYKERAVLVYERV